jgi:hypothetical protein
LYLKVCGLIACILIIIASSLSRMLGSYKLKRWSKEKKDPQQYILFSLSNGQSLERCPTWWYRGKCIFISLKLSSPIIYAMFIFHFWYVAWVVIISQKI